MYIVHWSFSKSVAIEVDIWCTTEYMHDSRLGINWCKYILYTIPCDFNICIFVLRIVLLEVDIAVLLGVDIAGHSCLRYAFCMVFHEIWIFLFQANCDRCRIWRRVMRKPYKMNFLTYLALRGTLIMINILQKLEDHARWIYLATVLNNGEKSEVCENIEYHMNITSRIFAKWGRYNISWFKNLHWLK